MLVFSLFWIGYETLASVAVVVARNPQCIFEEQLKFLDMPGSRTLDGGMFFSILWRQLFAKPLTSFNAQHHRER